MIKIAVCDDDRIDGEIIGRLLDQYALDHNQEILLRIFESGEKFLASKYIPDILLLDIFMYEKDGIQIGTEVREKYPDMIVIYTTNLKEKIMVAFNQLHVYGYLVKPINQEELYPILDDAIKVKSQKGNYYFWPVGFGLNGSLEEGEMNSHYMNAVCIERTKQLKRSKIVIEVD